MDNNPVLNAYTELNWLRQHWIVHMYTYKCSHYMRRLT